MNLLGLSYYYHDSAAALIQNGVLTAAAEEERFSRQKHDSGFPHLAIEFCLQEAGIDAKDLDYAVFYEKPLVKLDRIFKTALSTYPRSSAVFREAMLSWANQKLWIKSELSQHLNIPADNVLFVEHHMSHAASAFFCSPFEKSAVLTIDGVGEWTTAAIGQATSNWSGEGVNQIQLTHDIRFPHSLGLLYSAFTAFLGFEVNEGEYKVMGMAPYGKPRYTDKIYQVVNVADDGSFQLDMDYFSYPHSLNRTFSNKFLELFGKPRDPNSEFITEDTHDDVTAYKSEVKLNRYYADIAASIQQVTEEIVLKIANHLHKQTGLENLCMAGGVALNSVANGRILRETPFKEVFIHPAPGDSGGAVGAAQYVWHVVLQNKREFVMEHAYLGKGYSDNDIQGFLEEQGIPYETFADDQELVDGLAEDLVAGRVIGWFQGRFEWGPRALGNRSILADPRRAEMKEIVNSKIKFREPFRPFAPVILEEKAHEFFDGLPDTTTCTPARYMLLVLPWKDEVGKKVLAVNHMGTGRLQTIRRDWNPRYYDLVKRFGEIAGVPILMNTSFNLRGEPIVNTPADAWSTFSRSEIDVLVLGKYVVRKDDNNPLINQTIGHAASLRD